MLNRPGLIASQQGYFDAVERPSLLRHLWSLAVEEQFYIVWPLAVAVGLRFLRVRGLFVLTMLGALASAALVAILYDPGTDPSRMELTHFHGHRWMRMQYDSTQEVSK